MQIFNKLGTLMRAGVRESVEHLTDANAIRIYRQEIVEAEELMSSRRDALAAAIATRRETEGEISSLQGRIQRKEDQISRLHEAARSDELLQAAAREIASYESRLAASKQRHVAICEDISREELALRRLLGEIKEHRRDIKLLESQLSRQRGLHNPVPGQSISGRLASLRQTRATISDSVSGNQHYEAGMTEALERVESSALDRELTAAAVDDESLHIASVMTRLQGLASPA